MKDIFQIEKFNITEVNTWLALLKPAVDTKAAWGHKRKEKLDERIQLLVLSSERHSQTPT